MTLDQVRLAAPVEPSAVTMPTRKHLDDVSAGMTDESAGMSNQGGGRA